MIIRLLLLLNLLFISLGSSAEIPRPGVDPQSVTTIYTTAFVTDIDEVDAGWLGSQAIVPAGKSDSQENQNPYFQYR